MSDPKPPLMPPPARSLDAIVEERIQAAIARGELDDLPGAGKPLVLDDDPLVPAEVRVAYRVLKNAGFVPAEVIERNEAVALEARLSGMPAGEERTRAITRLALLRTRLGGARGANLTANRSYAAKLLAKLADPTK